MSSHRHPSLIRQIHARPRLIISTFVALFIGFAVPSHFDLQPITRILLGWNAGTWLYVALAGLMMMGSTPEKMRYRALQQDEGQWLVLALVVLAALASLAAIIAELAAVKSMDGAQKLGHIGLALLTVAASWTFTHVSFALHYAHLFYAAILKNQPSGLQFPGEEEPDYVDFLYLACIIGTSGQTADVILSSRIMRRTGLVHCVLAFLFNTTLLALTINIGASLI